MAPVALRSCHVTSSLQGSKRNLAIFEVFRAYLRESRCFFMKFLSIARFYRVLAVQIKSLIISTLVTLETRLKVPILAIYLTIDSIFQAVCFGISLWPKDNDCFTKIYSYLFTFTLSKRSFDGNNHYAKN